MLDGGMEVHIMKKIEYEVKDAEIHGSQST